jgi:hypothetical protein
MKFFSRDSLNRLNLHKGSMNAVLIFSGSGHQWFLLGKTIINIENNEI